MVKHISKQQFIKRANVLLQYFKPNWHLIGPTTYSKNGLSVVDIGAPFLDESNFGLAFEAAAESIGTEHAGPWRVYVSVWAALQAAREGRNLVECGVFEGFTSQVIMEYAASEKLDASFELHLIDSFEGIRLSDLKPEENLDLAIRGNKEKYSQTNFEAIATRFSKYKEVVIHRGFIPEILNEIEVSNIGYLHIDLNCAGPEAEAFRFFWPRIAPGGIIILDDYNWLGRLEQKRSLDMIADICGRKILSLPTGSGLVVK